MNTDSLSDSTCAECSVDPLIHSPYSLRCCSYSLKLSQIHLIQSTVKMQLWSKEIGTCEMSYRPAKTPALHCSINDRNRLIFQIYNSPEIQMESRRLDGGHHDYSLSPEPITLILFLSSFVFKLFSFSDY